MVRAYYCTELFFASEYFKESMNKNMSSIKIIFQDGSISFYDCIPLPILYRFLNSSIGAHDLLCRKFVLDNSQRSRLKYFDHSLHLLLDLPVKENNYGRSCKLWSINIRRLQQLGKCIVDVTLNTKFAEWFDAE